MNAAPGRSSWWPETLVLAGLMLVAWLVFRSGAIDLALASGLHSGTGHPWPVGEQPLWRWCYRLGWFVPTLLALLGLGWLAAGWRSPAWRSWRNDGLFLLLVLGLGSGLLVDNVLKEITGRPRPRELAVFADARPGARPAEATYQPPLVLGPGTGKSFPSGHAAGVFALLALWFPLRRRRRWGAAAGVLGLALGAGALMGCARMAQGGHFLSDIVWAALVPAAAGVGLAWLLLRRPPEMSRKIANAPQMQGGRKELGSAQ